MTEVHNSTSDDLELPGDPEQITLDVRISWHEEGSDGRPECFIYQKECDDPDDDAEDCVNLGCDQLRKLRTFLNTKDLRGTPIKYPSHATILAYLDKLITDRTDNASDALTIKRFITNGGVP